MSDNQKKLTRMPNRIPVEDVPALRLIVGTAPDWDYTILLGKTRINDGYAREYMWDATSMKTDDDDNYIRPNDIPSGSPGRWAKIQRSIPKTIYEDITLGAPGDIQQELTHNFDTESVLVEVYLRNQTINGVTGCDLKVNKDDLSATLFEIGAKDEDTTIVNLTDIPAGTYRFVMLGIPYIIYAP